MWGSVHTCDCRVFWIIQQVWLDIPIKIFSNNKTFSQRSQQHFGTFIYSLIRQNQMQVCTLMLQEQFPSTHVTSSDNSLYDCRAGHVRVKEYVLSTFYLLNVCRGISALPELKENSGSPIHDYCNGPNINGPNYTMILIIRLWEVGQKQMLIQNLPCDVNVAYVWSLTIFSLAHYEDLRYQVYPKWKLLYFQCACKSKARIPLRLIVTGKVKF